MNLDPSIRHIVVVSDLHCGSTVGLMPPGLELSEGRKPGQSREQEWIWRAWLDFREWVASMLGADQYALVVNGDAIEGVHHGTTEVVSPTPSDHVDIAIACLEPLAENAEVVYVVRGTECHTGPTSEAGVAVAIGGERDPRTGMMAFDVLDLKRDGQYLRFIHHMPATSRGALEGSQLSIQLAEHRFQAARVHRPMPDVVVMSHRHTYGMYSDGHALAVATPAWQLRTRHGKKAVPAAHVRVGGVLLSWHHENELPQALPRLWVAGGAA